MAVDPEVLALVKTGILYAFLLYVAYFGFFVFFFRAFQLRNFKGPIAFPMIGNLYDTSALQVIAYLAKGRRTYGKIFRFFTFNRPYVVLLDKTAAREALTDAKTFIKGPDYKHKFGFFFGEGLVTSNNEKHTADRKVLAKYFIQSEINKQIPKLVGVINDEINSKLPQNVGKSIDIELFFGVLAFNMFSSFALGVKFPNAKFLSEITSKGSNLVGEAIVIGWPMTDLRSSVKYVSDGMRAFYKQCDEVIDRKIEEIKVGTAVDDPCTAMINAGFTRKQLHEHLVTLCAAGHDTTAYACAYMIYLLAQRPDMQMKVKKEVKAVLGNRTNITAEDVEKLNYTKQCMQETLRIYSVIPHVTRLCTKSRTLTATDGSKHTIPEGCEIMVPICLLNRDKDEWTDPMKFDPDRFETIQRNAASKGYLPFGYGSRACIGATLAIIEGTIILALLSQKFRFVEDKGFDMKIISGISMVSANGVNVILEEEKEWDKI